MVVCCFCEYSNSLEPRLTLYGSFLSESEGDRSMKAIMKLIAAMLAVVCLFGCAKTQPDSASSQDNSWQAPALPEKQQILILDRAVDLMRESGHWQGYPLRSLGFDKARNQWRLVFGTDKPDEGYAVFIDNVDSDRIDICLLPPVWIKYERKKASNNPPHPSSQGSQGDR